MLYVGIDCGEHTGFAVWDSTRGEFLRVETLHLSQALIEVYDLHRSGEPVHVVFEDARQRKWIPRERNESQYRGRLMGAGSVKRDATVWQEFCEDNGIPFTARAPQKGMTKWSPQSFASVTGWAGRTSEHARDAALLVLGR